MLFFPCAFKIYYFSIKAEEGKEAFLSQRAIPFINVRKRGFWKLLRRAVLPLAPQALAAKAQPSF